MKTVTTNIEDTIILYSLWSKDLLKKSEKNKLYAELRKSVLDSISIMVELNKLVS